MLISNRTLPIPASLWSLLRSSDDLKVGHHRRRGSLPTVPALVDARTDGGGPGDRLQGPIQAAPRRGARPPSPSLWRPPSLGSASRLLLSSCLRLYCETGRRGIGQRVEQGVEMP